MPPSHRVRVRRRTLLAALAAVAAGVALLLPGVSGHGARPPARRAGTGVPAAAAPTTTTTAVLGATPDPGALPQTTQLPKADDVLFQAHVRDLWKAIVDDQPAEALPAFFPLGAYIQVKSIPDPAGDYQTRLITGLDQDVRSLHASLGSSGILSGISVPNTAAWILPGVEANKGSYWRVYGARISYTLGGLAGSFQIASMISWRGEWYVVHLGAIT